MVNEIFRCCAESWRKPWYDVNICILTHGQTQVTERSGDWGGNTLFAALINICIIVINCNPMTTYLSRSLYNCLNPYMDKTRHLERRVIIISLCMAWPTISYNTSALGALWRSWLNVWFKLYFWRWFACFIRTFILALHGHSLSTLQLYLNKSEIILPIPLPLKLYVQIRMQLSMPW